MGDRRLRLAARCRISGGVFARNIVLDGELAPGSVIQLFLRGLGKLMENRIKPIVVFDCATRPSKKDEAARRASQRKEAAVRARAMLRTGASAVEVNRACRAAAPITAELRQAAIGAAISLGVQIVVAPFEADGQLAFLYREGTADRIFTNDGDLGGLGCNLVRLPPRRSLDFIEDGVFYLYDFGKACQSPVLPIPPPPPKCCLQWVGMACGVEAFLYMAAFLGNDYDGGKGVQGVGMVGAYDLVQQLYARYGRASEWSPSHVAQIVWLKGPTRTRELYSSLAEQAKLMKQIEHGLTSFQNQLVWVNIEAGILGSLSGVPLDEVTEAALLPSIPDPATGRDIARGAADPSDPSVHYQLPNLPPGPMQVTQATTVLAPGMIAGATLASAPEDQTVDQLKLWLASRDMPTSGLKAILVGLVKAMQAAEDNAGGGLHVRDPGNVVTLGSLLQTAGVTDGDEQYDQSLTVPIGGWIEDLAALQVRAPLLSESAMQNWLIKVKLAKVTRGVQAYSESYTRGVSRCLNTPDLRLACGEPFVHGPSGRLMQWLRDKVPRSQAAENESNLRTVHILVERVPHLP